MKIKKEVKQDRLFFFPLATQTRLFFPSRLPIFLYPADFESQRWLAAHLLLLAEAARGSPSRRCSWRASSCSLRSLRAPPTPRCRKRKLGQKLARKRQPPRPQQQHLRPLRATRQSPKTSPPLERCWYDIRRREEDEEEERILKNCSIDRAAGIDLKQLNLLFQKNLELPVL